MCVCVCACRPCVAVGRVAFYDTLAIIPKQLVLEQACVHETKWFTMAQKTEREERRAGCGSSLLFQCCVPAILCSHCLRQRCSETRAVSMLKWIPLETGGRLARRRCSRHIAFLTLAECQSWRTHAKLAIFECGNEQVRMHHHKMPPKSC